MWRSTFKLGFCISEARLCDGCRQLSSFGSYLGKGPFAGLALWSGRRLSSDCLIRAACIYPKTVSRFLGTTPKDKGAPEDKDVLENLRLKDTVKNVETLTILNSLVQQAKKISGHHEISEATGRLLYLIATKSADVSQERSSMLLDYICNHKIVTKQQLAAAFHYFRRHPIDPLDGPDFDLHCGVGVTNTREEVDCEVRKVIERQKEMLMENGQKSALRRIMGAVRRTLKWPDPEILKLVVNKQLQELFGPDFETRRNEHSRVGNRKLQVETPDGAPRLRGEALRFHKPGENYLTEGYVVTPNTMELLAQHLSATGGKVVTRFPPEPNGILHIGHAMAINFNFGYAKAHGGICYLRYDDTDPVKEEERFIRGIQEMVEWLGHTPHRITFASDYFPQLYEYAKELIRRGHAYVCQQRPEELKGLHPPPSPWRERDTEESLMLFEDMKNGKFKDEEATLRMKLRMEDSKQDPVAYRIKHVPHPRTGNKWSIYPTYDFAHCLCDSIENISHSLCTKEFQMRRSSYYWLCNALDVYCPVQWEYGRLNVHYSVVSKRKIQKLIDSGIVRDWDDPRLFTLPALRRRGFPHQAINSFCAEYGVMVSDGAIYPELLESFVRDELNKTATRTMAVLDPLKVTITNFPGTEVQEISVPNFPSNPNLGTHTVSFDRVIYIEQTDFREAPGSGYRRLAVNQPVGLKHTGFVIYIQDIIKNPVGQVVELHVTCQKSSECTEKPKAYIHWVSEPLECTVRLYDPLFLHKDPEDTTVVPGGFLNDVNLQSLQVIENALIDRSAVGTQPFTKLQFERLGYFCVDPESSSSEKLVFNRTVSLKEDSTNPVQVSPQIK